MATRSESVRGPSLQGEGRAEEPIVTNLGPYNTACWIISNEGKSMTSYFADVPEASSERLRYSLLRCRRGIAGARHLLSAAPFSRAPVHT